MKHIFKIFTLSLLFFASCTMTVAEDIVAKEYFETTNISKISTDLTYENLTVKTTNGVTERYVDDGISGTLRPYTQN